jgi:hypothetical protein
VPVAAKKNRDQPDGENRSKGKIRPFHLTGDCEENDDCRRIQQAHDDSFPPVAP